MWIISIFSINDYVFYLNNILKKSDVKKSNFGAKPKAVTASFRKQTDSKHVTSWTTVRISGVQHKTQSSSFIFHLRHVKANQRLCHTLVTS